MEKINLENIEKAETENINNILDNKNNNKYIRLIDDKTFNLLIGFCFKDYNI